jgi:hypothetical protein
LFHHHIAGQVPRFAEDQQYPFRSWTGRGGTIVLPENWTGGLDGE